MFNLDECKIAKSLADDRLVPECRQPGSRDFQMDALGLEPAISRVFGPHFTTDKQPRFGLKHGGLWVAYPKGCFLTALNSAFLASSASREF